MLCDRCTINANCEQFNPNSVCTIEKEAYEQLVKELTKHYRLDMVADRILAERAAMYLIKISRVETYEALSGVTQKTVILGGYISRLDNTLRNLLNDLAISRYRRKGLEKREQLMVNIEDILERLANPPPRPVLVEKQRRTMHPSQSIGYTSPILVQSTSPSTILYRDLLTDWEKEEHRLRTKLANKHK